MFEYDWLRLYFRLAEREKEARRRSRGTWASVVPFPLALEDIGLARELLVEAARLNEVSLLLAARPRLSLVGIFPTSQSFFFEEVSPGETRNDCNYVQL